MTFRILALDGGGIMGTFAASVLATIEADAGRPVADHFDLITGTSTGGILAIGLGLGLSPQELLDFYVSKGPAIFPATGRVSRARGVWRQLWRVKHAHGPLEEALRSVLQERPFGASAKRLVIPAYDAVGGRVYLFKTPHHPLFTQDAAVPAAEVARATSAAPTYFEAAHPQSRVGAQFVDGGVWANNPSLVGLVEAVAFLGVPLAEVDILSIGTTREPFSIAKHRRSGALTWNKGLIDLLMTAQGESHGAMANLLTGGRVHRIDHMVPPGTFSLDDARLATIMQLVELGRGAAQMRAHREAVRARFVNGTPAAPYAPMMMGPARGTAAADDGGRA